MFTSMGGLYINRNDIQIRSLDDSSLSQRKTILSDSLECCSLCFKFVDYLISGADHDEDTALVTSNNNLNYSKNSYDTQ